MTFIPRNKQLRAILGGGAALSAVMVGPILVDASAQATPQSSCLSGGACLTAAGNTTVTVPVTTTETTTVPTTTTTTTTVPVTTTKTTTVPVTTTTTTTVPVTTTKTTTVPVTTTATTTESVTTTVPVTTTKTATATTTVTMPVTTTKTNTVTTTRTVSRRRPVTVTTTVTVTTGNNSTTTTMAAGDRPAVRGGRDWTATTSTKTTGTTTASGCTPPGQTMNLGSGQIETCGPKTAQVKVYATTPGLYTKIFDNTSKYYVSVGIFAPQYKKGSLTGCYYVPSNASVTSPGQTTTVASGVLADAVAFGATSSDVSSPRRVQTSDCS
jgi:hypothetical protein